MKQLELIRVCFLIVFNVGMGGVFSTIFSIYDNYANFFWVVIGSGIGNFLLVYLTEEKN